MAKISKDHKGIPPRTDSKGAPPPPDQPSHNLTKPVETRRIIINFNATEEFRKELKIYSTELGMTVTDVIMEAIELHKRSRK